LEIANVIFRSAQIREASYKEPAEEKDPLAIYFPGEYSKTLSESITEALKEQNLDPRLEGIFDLVMYWWNDAIAWAEEITGKSAEEVLGKLT